MQRACKPFRTLHYEVEYGTLTNRLSSLNGISDCKLSLSEKHAPKLVHMVWDLDQICSYLRMQAWSPNSLSLSNRVARSRLVIFGLGDGWHLAEIVHLQAAILVDDPALY